MPRRYTLLFFLLCAALLVSVAGCGSSGPALAPVTGIVTYKGQPLPDAKVVFLPAEGRSSTGVTDANGMYELKYVDETPGAEVGRHTVKIMTRQVDEFDIETAKEKLPAKYHKNTELNADVAPGGGPVNFDLE